MELRFGLHTLVVNVLYCQALGISSGLDKTYQNHDTISPAALGLGRMDHNNDIISRHLYRIPSSFADFTTDVSSTELAEIQSGQNHNPSYSNGGSDFSQRPIDTQVVVGESSSSSMSSMQQIQVGQSQAGQNHNPNFNNQNTAMNNWGRPSGGRPTGSEVLRPDRRPRPSGTTMESKNDVTEGFSESGSGSQESGNYEAGVGYIRGFGREADVQHISASGPPRLHHFVILSIICFAPLFF